MEAPHLEGLYQQYGEEKIHFIGAITDLDNWDNLNGSSWRTKFNPNLTYFLSTKTEFLQYESIFGSSGHPHNVLIGRDYKVTHIIGGWSADAITTAVEEAIELMEDMHVTNPIDDFILEYGQTTQIDISNVFTSSSNYDYTLEMNYDHPEAISAELNNKIISVTTGNQAQNIVFTLTGTSDKDSKITKFTIIINEAGVVPEVKDFESGSISDFWTFSGNSNWTVVDDGNGGFCAKTATIGDDQTTTIIANKTFSTGASVKFDRKISTEADFDYFEFFIDGEMKCRWSGEVGWATSPYYAIPEGEHAVKWSFVKDGGATGGSDCSWIDNVSFIFSGSVNGINSYDVLSGDFSLITNYPNPFNPSTTISFYTKKQLSNINISVYNAMGEKVVELLNGNLNKGNHSFEFDGTNMNSGVYYIRVGNGNSIVMTRKMLLVK